MPKSALFKSLPAEVNAAAFKSGLKRLHVLSERQFECGLSVEEVQELLAIRQELRAHMATWLKKR